MGFSRDLNLSDQQQQQIRDLLRQNRTKMIKDHAEFFRAFTANREPEWTGR